MAQTDRIQPDLDGEIPAAGRAAASISSPFVADVLERKPAAPNPPTAPTAVVGGHGFPAHRVRRSRFQRQRESEGPKTSTSAPASSIEPPFSDKDNSFKTTAHITPSFSEPAPDSNLDPDSKADLGTDRDAWERRERQRIDAENRQRLAAMSPAEIEQARAEMLDNLSPAFLERLIRRVDLASGSEESDLAEVRRQQTAQFASNKRRTGGTKNVSFAEPESITGSEPLLAQPDNDDSVSRDDESDNNPAPLDPSAEMLPPQGSIHFPQPSQPPDLDPSSSTFLSDLHEKYFPTLPSEPDKLEWMQAAPASTTTYSPSAPALRPREIRFSFSGSLLAPRTAAEIPVTAGLHHHGQSPDSAGYTIAELAHLARSAFAPQRCLAFQTLGRILYRLGRNEFGDPGEPGQNSVGAEDLPGELARGLWAEIEAAAVLDLLVRESDGKGVDAGRHVSARAYATEAVWLWRKGGGRRWKAD